MLQEETNTINKETLSVAGKAAQSVKDKVVMEEAVACPATDGHQNQDSQELEVKKPDASDNVQKNMLRNVVKKVGKKVPKEGISPMKEDLTEVSRVKGVMRAVTQAPGEGKRKKVKKVVKEVVKKVQ